MNKRKMTARQQYAKDKKTYSFIHIMISIVAIIECLMLITVSTYSWIESASSLIITSTELVGGEGSQQGEVIHMTVSNRLNNGVNVSESNKTSTNALDLQKNFSFVEKFQFASASSADGKTFYYPRKNNIATTENKYRAGDTTDFNTSHLYFDFTINNASNSNQDYYFDSNTYSDMFSFTDESGTPINIPGKDLSECMRVSVSSNTAQQQGSNPIICSKVSKTYYAQSGVNSTTEKTSQEYSYYTFDGTRVNHPLFQAVTNGTTNVSIHIWFEDKDDIYTSLTAAEKNLLYGSYVNVNMKLVNSANNKVMLYFDDYSMSNIQSIYGRNFTTLNDTPGSTYKMYFVYQNNTMNNTSSGTYIPMTIDRTASINGKTRWATCDSEGNIAPVLTEDQIKNLKMATGCNDPNFGVYSHFDYSSSAAFNSALARFFVQDNEQLTLNNGEYVYSLYGVTKTITDALATSNIYSGYGSWASDSTDITDVYYLDRNTANINALYNDDPSNFQYVNGTIDQLYVNQLSAFNASVNPQQMSSRTNQINRTIGFLYDQANSIYKTKLPTRWLSQDMYFKFMSNSLYSAYGSTVRVQWRSIASTVASRSGGEYNGKYVFTGLGYDDNGYLENNGIDYGYGTWEDSAIIRINTELVDTAVSGEYRYKVGNSSYTWYMVPDESRQSFFAYVPATMYNGGANAIRFKVSSTRNGNPDTLITTSARDGSDTFYPVTIGNNSMTGYWHIQVLVDETYDHLIYDSLVDGGNTDILNGGTLKYSINGGQTYISLDPTYRLSAYSSYAWYVPSITSSVSDVYYEWKPYGSNRSTTFTWSNNKSNGIYLTISE